MPPCPAFPRTTRHTFITPTPAPRQAAPDANPGNGNPKPARAPDAAGYGDASADVVVADVDLVGDVVGDEAGGDIESSLLLALGAGALGWAVPPGQATKEQRRCPKTRRQHQHDAPDRRPRQRSRSRVAASAVSHDGSPILTPRYGAPRRRRASRVRPTMSFVPATVRAGVEAGAARPTAAWGRRRSRVTRPAQSPCPDGAFRRRTVDRSVRTGTPGGTCPTQPLPPCGHRRAQRAWRGETSAARRGTALAAGGPSSRPRHHAGRVTLTR
jgi:hypothetical protein